MKIAFIAPYEDLAQLVNRVSNEMEINVDIFKGVFKDAAGIAQELEKQNYDVVISRGATYYSISGVVNIPVINCDITSFDILYVLHEATRFSKKIGLIIHEESPLNSELISDIFGIDLLYMTAYKNMQEMEKMVEEAVRRGSEVIIGGISTKEYAEKIGAKGILLKTSPETIRQVLKNAVEIITLTRKQILQAERLNQILNFSYEGIIVTDSNGTVTFFNPAAENIMGIKANDIVGNRADKYIPTTGLIEVVKTGEAQLGQVQKVRNATIIANRIPIKVKESIQGAVATFQDISKIQDYEIKIRSEIYKKGLVAKYTFENYVGKSKQVNTLLSKAQMYAKSDSTVLISGESGTGKEILAQSIHNMSMRKDYPFVAVNCSSIPEHLLESELFGYEEGAFTGAKKGGKMGLFELAHKGTIFLDEVGSMPINLQSSLLRVLQEREVWRVGSSKVIQIDVRVIAATNNNLFKAVEQGNFRRDLYYRLNVLKLETIPLRKRKDDIQELLNYYISIFCNQSIKINDGIKHELKNYYWPGNVRELQNFVERIALLHQHLSLEEIYRDFVEESETEDQHSDENTDTLIIRKRTLKEMEEEIISKLYKEYDENATLVSDKLRISRTTLYKKLNKKSL